MAKAGRKQKELDRTMEFLHSFLSGHGRTPTRRELATHFGVTPVAIHYRLHRLKKAGLIDLDPFIHHGIKIIQ